MAWSVYDANGALKTSVPTVAASAISGLVALGNGGTHADLSATGAGVLQQATTGADVTVQATTGSGDVVRTTSPTIVTPTIADLTNMVHSHQNNAGGGSLDGAAIGSGTVARARLQVMTGDAGAGGASGAVPTPASGDAAANKFLKADATWSVTPNGLAVLSANSILGGNAASFDLTSISGSYSHLKLLLKLRSDKAGVTQENIYLRFNNDSTAGNYYSYGLNENTATTPALAATERLGATGTGIEIRLGCTAATATSGYFAHSEVTILNYANANTPKQVFWNGGIQLNNSAGSLADIRGNALWTSTAAINRITILPVSAGNFIIDSSCELLAVA